MTRPGPDITRRRRSREWPELPMARRGAILALGWSVLALAEVLVFVVAIVPTLGADFSIHLSGRSATGIDLPVRTDFMARFALSLAIAAVAMSLVGALLTRRILRTAVVTSALICALGPVSATGLLRDSVEAAFDPALGPAIALLVAPILVVLASIGSFVLVAKPFAGRGKRARAFPG